MHQLNKNQEREFCSAVIQNALTLTECVDCSTQNADTERLGHCTCISLVHNPRLCSSLHLILTHGGLLDAAISDWFSAAHDQLFGSLHILVVRLTTTSSSICHIRHGMTYCKNVFRLFILYAKKLSKTSW